MNIKIAAKLKGNKMKSMENKYTLNQELKRLEPIERRCKYCDSRESDNTRKSYYFPIYKVKERTDLLVYKSVPIQQNKSWSTPMS